ncbi:MAG: TetR/AcrR family transcriptional regulator [Nannocystaceae bacterium]|nr:TetR/AcrR family transcriptional regulator [Nannocystaceae bacterium]
MPYAKDHKSKTRARILASAHRQFAEHGYDAASIDDIMKGAELTRGGFYAHFRNKEQLFLETILGGVVADGTAPWASARDAGVSEIEAMLRSYLSDAHIHEPAHRCPLITFPSEVARGTQDLRHAYQRVSLSIADALRSSMDGEDNRARSLAVLSIIVGASVLARAVSDEGLSREIRAASLEYALAPTG